MDLQLIRVNHGLNFQLNKMRINQNDTENEGTDRDDRCDVHK